MKPILFNTNMVRAILEGRKTVTRRVVKFLPGFNPKWTGYVPDGAVLYGSNNIPAAKAPCRPGDILYVRETWQKNPYGIGWPYFYRASPEQFDHAPDKWRPSIHMPHEAARIFLRVTDVRVERLQEITITGLQDEGIVPDNYISQFADFTMDAFDEFKNIWNRTINPAGLVLYGWDANPWAWVIEFERCEKPEGD